MFDVIIETELHERDVERILKVMDAEYDEDTDIVSFEYDEEMHFIYSEYVAEGIDVFFNKNYEELGIGFDTSIRGLANDKDDVELLKFTIIGLSRED